MNILHIVDEPYDSGIVHYALSAACALRDRGHAVHVAGKAKLFPIEEAGRLKLKTLALPAFPSSVVALRGFIQENKIDLINVHTGSSHTLGVLATRGLPSEIPVIRTRGDSRPVRRTATSSLLWQRTAGFIAATERILTNFKDVNPHLQFPMKAILPGIAGPKPSPLPDASVPRIGMLARLDPVKGHVHFVRAAQLILKEFPSARFLIAGREENVKTAELKAIAADLEIADQVEFLGHVRDSFEFMRGCTLGAISSIGSEAISRVAIEWMAAGRPVVSTSVGSLPEIVAEGETGYLVPPEDAGLMAKYILKLLKDRELAESFAANARRRYERRFGVERFADETEKFYEDAIHPLSPR